MKFSKKRICDYSENVRSTGFKDLPKSFWQGYPESESAVIKDMLFVRDESQKKLIVNESVAGWEVFVNESVAGWEVFVKLATLLDMLPDAILEDMFLYYQKRYKGITASNIRVSNDDEIIRQTVYCVIPEILWCHGDDRTKSLIWENK